MKKLLIAALLVTSAVFSFGQSPKTAVFAPASDLLVGYMYTSPDYKNLHFNGVDVAYTKDWTERFSLVGAASYAESNHMGAKQLSLTVGPRINFLSGPIRPYGVAEVGYAHLSESMLYAYNHHPVSHKPIAESGITYRAGLGVDVAISSHWYVRAVQLDVQPQAWSSHTPYYLNFTSGIGYRFVK